VYDPSSLSQLSPTNKRQSKTATTSFAPRNGGCLDAAMSSQSARVAAKRTIHLRSIMAVCWHEFTPPSGRRRLLRSPRQREWVRWLLCSKEDPGVLSTPRRFCTQQPSSASPVFATLRPLFTHLLQPSTAHNPHVVLHTSPCRRCCPRNGRVRQARAQAQAHRHRRRHDSIS
jgi:hypothetical protein